jgi:hypothetical protein
MAAIFFTSIIGYSNPHQRLRECEKDSEREMRKIERERERVKKIDTERER